MINIDYTDRRPLYQQIMEKIENLVVRGILAPDEQLPSVRTLAMDLSINPNTVQRAYMELEKNGLIYSLPGRGSFIARMPEELLCAKREEIFAQIEKIALPAVLLGIGKEDFTKRCALLYDKAIDLAKEGHKE